jgi:hypothetical protein
MRNTETTYGENFLNMQSLNRNILSKFDKIDSLDKKCENIESLLLLKIISRINNKISKLEDNLQNSLFCENNQETISEEKINSIENSLQNLELEFTKLERNSNSLLNIDSSEKVNKKIEENSKILDEIEKLTKQSSIKNFKIDNSKFVPVTDNKNIDITELTVGGDWIEEDWNNQIKSDNKFTDKENLKIRDKKSSLLRNKLKLIDEKIRNLSVKGMKTNNIDELKMELINKLVLNEKKIKELKKNLTITSSK